MRLRWLLLAVVTLSLTPSFASARTPVLLRPAPVRPNLDYTIGAAFEPGVHAGKLVLAFYNPDQHRSIEMPIRVFSDTIQYDWLAVEITNETTHRKLWFMEDREHAATETATIAPLSTVFETIDLDPRTSDLPPGEYTVNVTWAGHSTTTRTVVPYHCGLYYASLRSAPPPAPVPPPVPSLPSLPRFLVGGFAFAALVVAAWFAKRAGTPVGRVPCSAL